MKAVIDIGSNSVRLMQCRTLDGLHEKATFTTRLGEGLAQEKRLTDESVERTLQAIAQCKATALSNGATDIFAFATEAVRAAENGRAFTAAVERQTGLTVDVLSPQEEATVGYLGATMGLYGALAVIDVGGASAEIATGLNGNVLSAASIPMGAVRLKAQCGDDCSAARQTVDELLDGLPDPSDANTVVAIGGTATSLAAADLGLTLYDPQRVHRHVLTAAAIDALVERFAASSDRARDFPSLGIKRAQIILQGALIYQCICKRFSLPSVTVSETDNCEGYLLYKGYAQYNIAKNTRRESTDGYFLLSRPL